MSKPVSQRRGFPAPHHMTKTEAEGFLREQVLRDAESAGWVKPSVRKLGRGKDTVFYAFREVEEVSLRIAAGEYPTPQPQ